LTSPTYIEKKISDLLKLIPKLEIFYEHDDFSDSHFLKILPLEEFQGNKEYLKFEEEFETEFFSKYPFELITFLSSCDKYTMVNPKRFVAAQEFAPQIFEFKEHFNFTNAITNLLENYTVEMPTSIHFSSFINAAKFRNTYEEVLRQSAVKETQSELITVADCPIINLDPSAGTIPNDNDDYTLAA
jgi:hypothetical protein